MNALEAELRAIIAAEGPLSIERWMALCLQHPRHGYYTTRDSIGRAGDFITAPEIDQMFGELLGLWAAQVWMDTGRPDPVRLVELGPGRGTLMADALRATRIVPGFHAALRVHLVETSPRLRAAQRDKLADAPAPVAWHDRFDEVPAGPALILANEFFDTLPVRHYVRSARGWHERVVGLDADGRLAFGAAPETLAIAGDAKRGDVRQGEFEQGEFKQGEFKQGEFKQGQVLEVGQILEVAHVAQAAMVDLAARVVTQGGALLVCDYGHARSALGETLQAVRGHAYADPLADPGEADLTAHVDFAALARAAAATGARTHGPVAQGVFLERMGLVHRASHLKLRADDRQRAAIDAAVQRFTAPGSSMATLFKALAVTRPDAPTPSGFAD